jgi:hypothetical protein
MRRWRIYKILLALTLVLITTGCIDNKVPDTKTLKIKIDKLKIDACETWSLGSVIGRNVRYVDTVYMPNLAAKKFSKLSAVDPSYDYASKAAYTLSTFNGSSIAENLKPLVVLALSDLKRACLG